MPTVKSRFTLCLAAAALLQGCATLSDFFFDAGPPPPPEERRLADWPWREYWTGVIFIGNKIGFTHLALRPAADAPGRFEIESEAVLRLRFLGYDKRVSLRALDRVRDDLTLERFGYQYDLDGSVLKVTGEADGRELRMRVEASGSTEAKTLALAGPLYPSSAVNLLPVMRGLAIGRSYRYTVLNGETQALAEAEQEVLAYEASTVFAGSAFKLRTRALGLESTTWITANGRPVFELALRGVMISALEDEGRAKRYLVAANLNRDEALLGFSVMRVPPLDEARRVSRLEIALEGVPPELGVPDDAAQRCTRDGTRLGCTVDRDAAPAAEPPARLAAYLKPSLVVTSADPEIARLARELQAGAGGAPGRVARIIAWMEANIGKAALDVFTASDVLRERRAECQGFAYLFAALARAMGIPARVVNGIVYSRDHGGFVYHSWNEVHLEGEGWRAVDAIFGQARADATHVKLIEGESLVELVPLAGMVGRASVAEVRALARW